ncbi:MAG: epoxyqueuosine reductase [Eubacteriaceae bacterium]|jgi:epoxyqueuosine reductase QueG|nr:epoxyqueuosine reductase [Eubacteriaceae bacterium]
MKETIRKFVRDFVKEKDKGGIIKDIWREPLVGFGDARHPRMGELKTWVQSDHVLPSEVLPEAQTIITYFLPMQKTIGDSNIPGRLSSKEWAMAYEKTNATLGELGSALSQFLKEQGYPSIVPAEATQYDERILMSKWSQRHLAWLCGLGTFGINNMFITAAGTCGRLGSTLTALELEVDGPLEEEYCLYKIDGSCGLCIDRCPVQALTTTAYDRFKCNDLCADNAKVHVGYGSSYLLEDTGSEVLGTNTCGKCVVGVPCTYRRPKTKQ